MQLSNRSSANHVTQVHVLSQIIFINRILLQHGAVHLLLLVLSALVLGLTLNLSFATGAQASSSAALTAAPSTAASINAITTVIYVDSTASSGSPDGNSWATAFPTLQDALAVASAGDEIWVAAGVYYPDEGGSASADSVSATIVLQNGVAIYGGFVGSESVREERDWRANLTILSGDLTQNDPNDGGIIDDPQAIVAPNAYHVVTASGVDESAILDGFVVTGGHAMGTFVSPCGDVCGGGLFVENSTALLQNLQIIGNAADSNGAGIALLSSQATIESVDIRGNYAGSDGGGLYARDSGGAVTNVLLSGNRSSNTGGAFFTISASAPLTLTNVTMSGNRAANNGGAIVNRASTMLLRNSLVWNNTSSGTTSLYIRSGGLVTTESSFIEDSYIDGVWDTEQGTDGGNNQEVEPLFVAPIDASLTPTITGDFRLQPLSPAADAGNSALNTSLTALDGENRIQGAAIDVGAYESDFVASLAITKTVEPETIEYGESITYTIVLSNSGEAFAYSTVLTDILPNNVSFSEWLQQPAGTVYTSTGAPRINWEGTVPADTAHVYQFVATHTGAADEPILNTASFAHSTTTADDSVSATVLPLPTVDIADIAGGESDGSLTFVVSLSATSRKAVSVDYFVSDNETDVGVDYTEISGTLTIPAGTLTETITVDLLSDFVDETNENFNLILVNPIDGQFGDNVAVGTILDDDTAGSAVAPTALAIDEPAETAQFTITLTSQPVAPVTVNTTNSDTSECSLPAAVTLDESNWQNGLAVTVQAVDDFVVDQIQTCLIGLTTESSDPLYHNKTLTSVQVDVNSDDTAGITIAPTNPIIGEAGITGYFTVTLTSQPTATVNIALAADDNTECSVINTIALDETNWRDGVAVPVTTIDDLFDDDDQTCTISSIVTSVDGNYDGRAMASVPVTVVDDDTAGLGFNTTTLTTSEPAGQTSFAFSLTSKPTADVTVALTSQDPSECTVPASITFAPERWNVDVTVVVNAVDDRIDDDDQRCVIQTDVSSDDPKYADVAAADIDVTVQNDGDNAAVLLSSTTVSVTEPATSAELLVTLNSEPVAPVTIDLASQDNSECAVTASVTLNAANWQDGLPVTITAIDDNIIDGVRSCTIATTATSADAKYDGIAVADPVADVYDNDYADVILESVSPFVREPDNSTLLILKLSSIPTNPVTVELTSTDAGECRVPTAVTLDSSNWDSGAGTLLFAVDDEIDDGDQTCNLRATITSRDGDYDGLTIADFSTTVGDDDVAGTTVSTTAVTVGEPTGTTNFRIALNSEPVAPVTVTLTSGDAGECRVPATTILNTGNWRDGVLVTVSAIDDDLDDETQPCPIETGTMSDDPNYQGIAIDDVMASVTDDEVAGVTVEPTRLTIGEPAITDTFTIRLTSEPTQTVSVNLSSSDSGECVAQAVVELDAVNWRTGVVVPVQAVDDRIDDADQLCTLITDVTSADGDYAGIETADVAVTVQDDADTASINVSTTALTVSEPAEASAFTVTLSSEPVAAVTIQLTPSDSGECAVPTTVSLDATTWEAGVAVPVTALDDDVDDDTQSCVVQTDAVSADPLYNGMAVADVQTTVLDEDSAGFALSTATLTITEPSEVQSYTLSLTSEPVAPVNVALQSSDSSECTVAANVILDAESWRGVAIGVHAVNDDVMDGAQACVIESTVTSVDPLYDGQSVMPMTTTVRDDDVAGVVISPMLVEVNELGGSVLVTVALTSEPVSSVSIDLLSTDSGECAAPANVTLTPQNWRSGVALPIAAVDDFQADGDQSCLVETSAVNSLDANYAGMVVDDITATVIDDESIAVLFTPAEPVVREPDSTTTVRVQLGSLPTVGVNLVFTSGDTDECMVTGQATLTPINWRSGVEITVTAVDDTLDDGTQSCTIATAVTSGDGDYNGLAVAGLAVQVEDNDRVTMTTAVELSHAVAEIGETVTYTYVVTNTGDVPLRVTATDSQLGTVTFSPATVAPQSSTTGQMVRTVQEKELPGPVTTDVLFEAESTLGTVITDTQTTSLAVAANPQLVVDVERLGPPIVSAGSVVTYQVTITNTGHVPAKIMAIEGQAAPPTRSVDAGSVAEEKLVVAGAGVAATCTAPLTVPAQSTHQCTMQWTATEGESDAVEFTVRVDAEGLLDFTATESASDIVVISTPTSAGSLRIFLPVVSR